MNLEQLTLGEFKELAILFEGLEKGTKENIEKSYGKCIVILQRGWIVVGDLNKKGEEFTLADSSVIRNWGTTKGLGEIAENGPTKETILDKTPEIIFHELTVVAIIKCKVEKW
jgi:hypothetical protein